MSYKTYGFTEQQIMVRDSVLGLLKGTLTDSEIERLEANCEYPEAGFQALAANGWLGLPFDEKWGGANAGHKDMTAFVEATAYHHPGTTSAFMTTVIYAGMYIQYHGTPEQQEEFLPKIIAGKCKMGVAYTEPSGGSDAAGIKTRAVRDGNDYVLTGQKVFITNAHVADYLVVTAKTSPDGGHRGISLFIVDTKAPGVEIRRMRAMGRATSSPNEVFLDDVHVPAKYLLGGENEGWKKLMRGLNLERVLLAAASCGQCLRIIEIAADWARERKAFGKIITEYQAISHKFADMQMLTESARLHTYSAAEMLDAGVDAVMETSMCKVIATENNMKVADHGVQIMGGAGYVDGPMSRLFRDARVGPIGGGSSEIMRNVIAKLMRI
jgi:alkylation response protein AidB-like acyl-CoA dehydrogenase